MTIELLDPNDTGGFKAGRYDSLGTEPTEDLRHHLNRRDTTGENTKNLAADIAELDGLQPRRRPAADLTATVRLVEPPLGLTHPRDLAAAQPIAPLERVAGVGETAVQGILESLGGVTVGVDGELEGPQKPVPAPKPLRPAAPGRYVPFGAMVAREPQGWWARLTYRGRHRGMAR